MMRPHVFVVEGKNDKFRLERLLDHPLVVMTNGSAIDDDSILMLKKLDKTHDIILFLDPDHAGERIRRLVGKEVTHVYHAFIKKEDAVSKNLKKVGVEHAPDEAILEALKSIKMVKSNASSDITHAFLHEIGLTGDMSSKAFRYDVCEKLGIGFTNGKTLYHRLHMFGINKQEIMEVIHATSSEKEVRTELFKR